MLPSLISISSKLNSLWLRYTYPFAEFGRGASVHHSCEIRRPASTEIELGDKVYLAPEVWLDVAPGKTSHQNKETSKIVIGNGSAIGRRCTISAKNRVELKEEVLLAPSVLIKDHDDFGSERREDGGRENLEKSGGRIVIERNCWLGIGAVIACTSGELVLGHNSVVGANAVVTRSFPPFSVIAGNPAVLIKTYDETSGRWVKAAKGTTR